MQALKLLFAKISPTDYDEFRGFLGKFPVHVFASKNLKLESKMEKPLILKKNPTSHIKAGYFRYFKLTTLNEHSNSS